MKRIALLMSVLFTMLMSSRAQSPAAFSFQAVVRNANGSIVPNQQVKFRISIVKDAEAGPIVYAETHSVQTNEMGLVQLPIGKGNRITSYGLFSDIEWSNGSYFLKNEVDPQGGNSFIHAGTSPIMSVPYALYAANADASSRFEVRGNPDLSPDTALFEVKDKSGFTVFAVYEDGAILNVTPGIKGGKGGFAVGGRVPAKGNMVVPVMWITPDTAHFMINDAVRFDLGIPVGKGGKGGFAVGGRTSGKGPGVNYFNISPNAMVDTLSSQPRILWYPRKEAFLVGRVLVENPDSVGTNSTSTGFESKAIGNWSQAFGFKAIARKDYATAIGKNPVAAGNNSFAFGDGAKALQNDSYAFGAFTESTGNGSFAFGFVGRDSLGPTGKVTRASGDASFAFGLGTTSSNVGSMGMGAEVNSSGIFSFATGFRSMASDWCATALGDSTLAYRGSSTAMGYKTKALEWASTSMGHESTASGPISLATGFMTTASGGTSFSMGNRTRAEGGSTLAGGYLSISRSWNTMAFGDSCVADSPNSQSFGVRNYCNGNGSAAFGSFNKSLGDFSISFGNSNLANGQNALATGFSTNASGINSSTFGARTIARASSSFAAGDSSIASGTVSFSLGFRTMASGWTSSAFGQETKSSGSQSFSAGYQSEASGGSSAAFGGNSRATNTCAFSTGAGTLAAGINSFVSGSTNKALGDQTSAFGYQTISKGNNSVSMGEGIIAKTFSCLAIGAYNDTSGTTREWYNRWDPVDPVFVVGDGESDTKRSNAFTVLKNGNVGIDTSRPTQRLDIVRGNGRVQSGYNWLTNSDLRYKKNISTLSNSLEKVLAIRGVRYDLKDEVHSISGEGKYIGFIAQELEKEFPEFVVTDEAGYKAVAYDKLTVVLVESVKEQQKQIDRLTRENIELKNKTEQIDLLRKELEELKTLVKNPD